MKMRLQYVHDFILLLLLSLLTERDEMISIVIFLSVSYVALFALNAFIKKKNIGLIILLILQIIGCAIFLSFSVLGTILLPLFFFIVHATEFGSPVQKSIGAIVWFVVSALFYPPFPPLWKLMLLVLHILLTFWLTGANRNQQLVRFISIITIGIISALLIPIFPYIRLILSYIVEKIALGFGFALSPLFSAAELKDTDDFWNNKGHINKPQIEEGSPKEFDPIIVNSITIIIITCIAFYIIWKVYKKREYFKLPNIPIFESILITDKEGTNQKPIRYNKPPKNEVRKEIFKLEKKLTPPLNRKRGETVDAWMERIQTEEDVSIQVDTIIKAYNTVRYANQENNELFRQFKEEVNKLYAYQKTLKKKK
ncbi:DUF4018 domain-containing protein [Bacillus pseudomycoides]|uniref:DUF4018 domain-containing protein n=1 Tax=Bacillus pseudomycoides TaxID=64104 RepID=UPI000BEBE9BD|nr:DUF4018 domain-containing protein [Bacillus pseudomycoides]PEB38333.1 hypothetical protein COO06_29250 [Bacillus pseudomycoides]PGD92839.1 hypothetical protein COM50_21365 [Bacillus pseudomycoides]PGD96164.1 hypothetical protein COM49_26425 [Bacillus pseudomycoides]PHE62810.1 hypothetical protein COF69_26820 [Bacillus pseudomycoides]PHG16335.1 hypothetical protein COI47_25625 [Bacillus pseudomycoides]